MYKINKKKLKGLVKLFTTGVGYRKKYKKEDNHNINNLYNFGHIFSAMQVRNIKIIYLFIYIKK